ncbi:FecR domain-containing protein [Cupriavidus taiwanensis]|uniref:FecR protein domain-containing protein n=2 Tax=Cupriavidus taiwanensis TaxID=164546 RepID=A0A7Z7NP37_9BURK|nr:FecR domain-containing protein [Cupriavidus taiwanensis]SOY64601.1 hypothetical protein; putative exported protein [Cupriavidus taiwanensis]SOZ08658.1 hypothetical protein; putative exported protein [Cupriavidus taiwanensis]SOZ10994.1 hypothetical protein; putative exported protein [Cupriavidus taiwanensis]SOZ42319.1 hypothetical protein; putative exported protein [Cupriavidus taiwanensis]SPC21357.1 hypothetical protein; putative exported protein [Cupriavidus taiwanensis]
MNTMIRGMLIGCLSIGWAVLAWAQGPAEVGKIAVVAGSAWLEAHGQRQPLQAGSTLHEGATLETGSDGYVYVNTVDRGFVSLRPNSSLTIEAYAYDSAAPANTQIKLRLNRGVVRTISGEGAQAARERFRMNTPVAAIGIRGTDFSVFTDARTTRASVRAGGIVMSPFLAGCRPAGTGPCEGGTGLSSQAGGSILQLRHGETQPTLLGPQFQHLSPEAVAPPGKDEGSVAGGQVKTSAVSAPAVVTANEIEILGDAVRLLPEPRPAPAPVPETPVVRPQPVPPAPEAQKLFWGRYQALASLPADTTLEALRAGVHDIVAMGGFGPFALVRDSREPMTMPVKGVFGFQLKSAEAYVVGDGKATAATVADPSLVVDFGKRRFDTSLTVSTSQLSHSMRAQGSVTSDGMMRSDQAAGNAMVRGALAGTDASQAGYVFSSQIGASGQTAVGATNWGR